MGIDILIPTRKRVDRLKETLESIEQTKSDNIQIRYYIYWDHDDQKSLKEYIYTSHSDTKEVHYIGSSDEINLSQMWNKLAEISSGDILMHAGDDIIFETKDWDLMVEAEFIKCEDKILLVYGDDGIQREKLATHGFYSRKAMEVIGYFMPPYFEANYNDTWWTNIYGQIGRKKYLPNMKIEHMHFNKYPGLMDETYLNAIEKRYAISKQVWDKTKNLRMQDIEKLKQYIKKEAN